MSRLTLGSERPTKCQHLSTRCRCGSRVPVSAWYGYGSDDLLLDTPNPLASDRRLQGTLHLGICTVGSLLSLCFPNGFVCRTGSKICRWSCGRTTGGSP